jgi:outer membrane protein, heavy metal efflux system
MSVRTFSAGALLLAAVFSIRAQGVAGRPTPLNDLIAEAEKSNTEILAAEHTWRAATHVRQQVTTLPNPQFSLQELSVGSPKPFAGFNTSNFAYFGIGASQELPYPGKLRLKGEAADRAADVQQAQITVARASVADDIKAAYLKLAYLQETLPLLDTSRNTLGQIIETELARYRIGRGSQADVLKAQLERTKLVREITMHHEEVAQVEADLKRLVHRTQESPDIVAQVLAMTNLQYTSVQLLNLVRTQNPELKLETSRIGKQNAELRSAERSGKPDFSIGYMYQRTGDDFPAYYMLTFNVILQRRERVRAELAEANESIKAAEEQFDSQLQHQLAEVQKQYAAAMSTAEMLTEYHDGMIPQADAGFRVVLAGYETSKEELDSVLASFNEIVALKREYEQTLLDHELAVAKLETLTGETLR